MTERCIKARIGKGRGGLGGWGEGLRLGSVMPTLPLRLHGLRLSSRVIPTLTSYLFEVIPYIDVHTSHQVMLLIIADNAT